MTLEQIDYFICTVQSRTFFDAAETMHISQSSLSKQIMKLEKELDLTLWDRSKRTAVLTPAGEFFYKEALKISRQYHRSMESVSHFKDCESQTLHIGTLPFLSQYHLTSVIHSFCAAHPELSFSLKEVEDQDLLSGLEKKSFRSDFCTEAHAGSETLYFSRSHRRPVGCRTSQKSSFCVQKNGLSY